MKHKFEIGQVAVVDSDVKATIVNFQPVDGTFDYLVKALDGTDLCKCGEKYCGGGNWFLEEEVSK